MLLTQLCPTLLSAAESPITSDEGREEFLRNFLAIVLVSPDYAQRLENTGAKIVLIEAGSVLDNFLARQAEWREAYRDKLAVIYQRVRG